MKKILLFVLLSIYSYCASLDINILYLEQKIKKPPALSNVIEEPTDSGLKGLELAIIGSNKTAKFFNRKYHVQKAISFDKNELIQTFEKFVKEGNSFVILNVEDELLQKLSDLNRNVILINSTNTSTYFRQNVCNNNLLHTTASDAMLYDGLIQFFIKRNWKEWLLIKGTNKEDERIVTAIKRAAKRFGGKIVEEKTWDFNTDIRRKAQSEMPSFTQGKDHDVVLVADYFDDFGEFLYFNTWRPRPIAGTSGLTPTPWHKVIEAWGAAQLHSRFEKYASRWMNEKDYTTWVAAQIVVTAVSKTNSIDVKSNLDFLYSDKFDLGAYMGRKLTFRPYNGQLRFPIPLIHPKALVSTSPQLGFLHPVTDLDTLGIAKYEMKCKK